MKLSIITAVAKNGVIGVKNTLPWKLRADMDNFMTTTKGRAVIVGHNTHESIMGFNGGKPLPGRHTIVLSHHKDYVSPGCLVMNDWDQLLEYIDSLEEEVFCIGGAKLYEQMLPLADRAIITWVDAEPKGDAIFPFPREYFTLKNGWKEVSSRKLKADKENEHTSEIVDYERASEFVYIPNARTFAQRQIMRQIRADGVCPFCRENLQKYHTQPILEEGKYWVLSPSQYPRPGSQIYLMAFYKEHVCHLSELPPAAGAELFELAQKYMKKNKMIDRPGGLAIRFGSPEETGGTIHHIHAHLIFPDPNADPVRFKIGPNR